MANVRYTVTWNEADELFNVERSTEDENTMVSITHNMPATSLEEVMLVSMHMCEMLDKCEDTVKVTIDLTMTMVTAHNHNKIEDAPKN